MKHASENYNQQYFESYRPGGLFGASANRIKFDEFVKPGLKVLDFGCAAGDLLASYSGVDAFGVEINPAARAVAEQNGLTCFASSDELPEGQFDLIISDNALEHTENPLRELRNLHRSLKSSGMLCIVVPLDHKSFAYKPNNIDYHLFSWSPMNLGNLLNCAGFSVLKSEPFVHKWMPGHQAIVRAFGWRFFHLAARIYGRIDRRWCQTRAVAVKD
jgi:SAM-dependent methyltransferase